MSLPRQPSNRIGLWVFSAAASWAAGMALLDASGDWPVAWLAAGFVIGGGQWFLVNRQFPHSRWWGVAYSAGWCLALWVSLVTGFIQPNILFLGLGGGAVTGILQAVALRQQLKRSGLWILASPLVTFVGCWVGSAVGNASYRHDATEMMSYLIGGAVGGAVLGLLSGFAFARMTRSVASLTVPVTPASCQWG